MFLEKSSEHAISHSCDTEGRAELNRRTQSLKKKNEIRTEKDIHY